MRIKIYLDTSTPSAYYDKKKPVRQKITQEWWNNIMFRNYEVYISEVTVTELSETTDIDLRNKLLRLVKPIQVLEIPKETKELAEAYIDNDIIPEDYLDDALHVAITTFYYLDILVSWNFEHLVNPIARRKIKAINLFKGYKEIDIASPEELGGVRYE